MIDPYLTDHRKADAGVCTCGHAYAEHVVHVITFADAIVLWCFGGCNPANGPDGGCWNYDPAAVARPPEQT